MENPANETLEKLVRVRAIRRGQPVELRVHYSISSQSGCRTFEILAIHDVD